MDRVNIILENEKYIVFLIKEYYVVTIFNVNNIFMVEIVPIFLFSINI